MLKLQAWWSVCWQGKQRCQKINLNNQQFRKPIGKVLWQLWTVSQKLVALWCRPHRPKNLGTRRIGPLIWRWWGGFWVPQKRYGINFLPQCDKVTVSGHEEHPSLLHKNYREGSSMMQGLQFSRSQEKNLRLRILFFLFFFLQVQRPYATLWVMTDFGFYVQYMMRPGFHPLFCHFCCILPLWVTATFGWSPPEFYQVGLHLHGHSFTHIPAPSPSSLLHPFLLFPLLVKTLATVFVALSFAS